MDLAHVGCAAYLCDWSFADFWAVRRNHAGDLSICAGGSAAGVFFFTSLATILIVLLSLIFRFGISKERKFSLRARGGALETLHNFREDQCATRGMRPEAERKVEHGIHELISSVLVMNPMLQEIEVELNFDDLKLTATVEYEGVAPVLPEIAPLPEELATMEGISALSGFMIRQYADRVRVKVHGANACGIQLVFER